MSAQRCTCCHICHTSLKTSRRSFLPCTTCQSIVCQPCIELTGQDFSDISNQSSWSCPRCCGNCPCKRCRNKVSKKSESLVFSSSVTSDKLRQKRKRTSSIIDESSFTPTKIAKSGHKLLTDAPSTKLSSSTSGSISTTKDDQMHRIVELRSKNQQCIEYILRTERLLALIRSEQDRIALELDSIASRNNRSDTETNGFVGDNDVNPDYTSDSDCENNSVGSSSDVDDYALDSPEATTHRGFTLQSLVDHIEHEYVLA